MDARFICLAAILLIAPITTVILVANIRYHAHDEIHLIRILNPVATPMVAFRLDYCSLLSRISNTDALGDLI